MFQTHCKAVDSDTMLIETKITAGYHRATNLTTTHAKTQSALVASELALTLQNYITPSIASSSNLPATATAEGTPPS
jgi:hypothetical protein